MVRSQLNVVKADGRYRGIHSHKSYRYDKYCFKQDWRNDSVYIAEQLADVVTYYLYHEENIHSVTSNEIFSVIVAVLTETGYENAADAL